MAVDERVLDAIAAVYEAALDETLWSAALQKLAAITNSQAATFWVLDGSAHPRLPIFSFINLDPKLIQEYLDGMAAVDPTVQYLVTHPGLPIVHDGLFITEREKDRHAYYDWHHRYTDMRFRLISRMSPAPAIQAGVALHRQHAVGRFESGDIEQFETLHRHVERALTLGFRLGSLGSLQQGWMELLDRNSAAILLLDAQQHVIYANQAAVRLCRNSDGLRLSTAGVIAMRRQDNDHLQRLIAQAMSIHAGQSCDGDGVMLVQRPSGKRSYLLLIAPMSKRNSTWAALQPTVSVVITDPELQPAAEHERLRVAFGLTRAEARLAVQLAAGDALQFAAAKLSISYGTARARLAEIFRKTDTHRQGELVKLLWTTLTMK